MGKHCTHQHWGNAEYKDSKTHYKTCLACGAKQVWMNEAPQMPLKKPISDMEGVPKDTQGFIVWGCTGEEYDQQVRKALLKEVAAEMLSLGDKMIVEKMIRAEEGR